MADIKRLHKIIHEMGSDPDVSMHELVREVLKQDHSFKDYYLENISKPVSEDEKELSAYDSPAQESIEQVQARLNHFLKEDEARAKNKVHDKAATTLETIEQLRSKAKNGWTEAVTPDASIKKSEK